MLTESTRDLLIRWADIYNDRKYFEQDPIIFPRRFEELRRQGRASLQDIEIAGIFSAHFAWGRRAMIVRDCTRLFTEMDWKPYDYVMRGRCRCDDASIHRTVKWSETAAICSRLRNYYEGAVSLERLPAGCIRTRIFGQKEDPKAPNKKINMMRRWFVRDDGKVDLGIWKDSDPDGLLIPLDVHVYDEAAALGLTARKQKDSATVEEITDVFRQIFPGDPCKGDFSLFGYGVTHSGNCGTNETEIR